jgi:hypothetical protein
MQTYWLMLKQSFFRKHDFAACVHQIYHNYQNRCFWQFKKYSKNSHTQIKEECSDKSTRCHFYGGGKALIFSSNELHTYASTDLNEQQYQFQQCVKKDNKQKLHLNDGDVLCSVPLNILAPKLTLKAAKELANLRDMYMPSKILLGGVGHCFAWHVQVSIGLYFNFKTEELVSYRLCVM